MKRVCTKAEQELLYHNRKQLLKGLWITAKATKLCDVFISLVVCAVIMFAGIFWVLDIVGGSRFAFILWLLFSLSVPRVFVMLLINAVRMRKKARLFFTKEGLMINGATVVGADENRFAYIEDDLTDESGRPIVIEYPLFPKEMTSKTEGERMLVVYDSENTFQLMWVNDALRSLLPADSAPDPLEGEIDTYICVPCPNMLKLDRERHALSDAEKKKYAMLYAGNDRQAGLGMVKIFVTIIVVCLFLICFILDSLGEIPFYKTAPVLFGGFAVYVLFLYLLMRWSVKRLKPQLDFVYVKEVAFCAFAPGAMVNVYEWIDGKINLCTYPAGKRQLNVEYGSILYRLENAAGQVFLMNKE